jgi:hypothetical protein
MNYNIQNYETIYYNDLKILKGFIKKKILNINKIYPNNIIDVCDLENRKSLDNTILLQYGIIKRNSREKRKIIRKYTKLGLDMFEIIEILKNIFNKNFSTITKEKIYIINEFNPKINIINHIPIQEQMFPLQITSRKMKTPCGTTLQYFKNYLQYLKNLQFDDFVKKVNITFHLTDFVIDKYYKKLKLNYSKKNNTVFDFNKELNLMLRYHYHASFYPNNLKIYYGQHEHNIIPLVSIECPCSLMTNEKCKKTIDLELFILILKLYSNESYTLINYIKFIYNDFIIPVIKKYIENSKNKLHVITKHKLFYKEYNNRTVFIQKEKISVINHELTNVTCAHCLEEHICCTYKLSKNFIKKKHNKIRSIYTYKCIKKTNIMGCCCSKCGNYMTQHRNNKCPPPIKVDKPSPEQLNEIQKALNDDNVESALCPKCNNIVTKDEHCDKVRCGAIDGGRYEGCGIQFCFRCGDDLTQLRENYLQHLITVMKPDKTQTQWICKKFAIECPICKIKQYWDGKSDKIMCGECNIMFDHYM